MIGKTKYAWYVACGIAVCVYIIIVCLFSAEEKERPEAFGPSYTEE